MLGKIKGIEEITNVEFHGAGHLNGQNGARLGVSSMLSTLGGFGEMDGFKVTTNQHTFYVLIDNGQSCCEDWGYFSSEDDSAPFVGAELKEVKLTDTALNQKVVEESAPYGFDAGGIQFVDFVTSKGTFQLAVYNAHNGYYGHGILVLKDEEVILNRLWEFESLRPCHGQVQGLLPENKTTGIASGKTLPLLKTSGVKDCSMISSW